MTNDTKATIVGGAAGASLLMTVDWANLFTPHEAGKVIGGLMLIALGYITNKVNA